MSKIDRCELKKLNTKIPHDHDSLGKSDMLVVTKENSYGRMNVSAEKYTCSFLQNVIKLKRILSAIMMGHCNRWCMYHEVYQKLVVIFVPKPLTVSKWRIIVGHSLNHISCDSSWFSPDTGHRSSESCFSGSHLCMLTLLSI